MKDNYYPTISGHRFFIVLSDSMQRDDEESINKGALIIAREVINLSENEFIVPYEQIEEGNVIISYKLSSIGVDTIITHRIISAYKDSSGKVFYRTKGDNLEYPDNYIIENSDIVGLYTGTSIDYLGYIFGFMSSYFGYILVLNIMLIVLCSRLIIDLFNKKYVERTKKRLLLYAYSKEVDNNLLILLKEDSYNKTVTKELKIYDKKYLQN
jgi:signal peptidase I